MTALIVKMTFWLLAAMALGLIVAWLLSRIVYQKRQREVEDSLSAVIVERNNMIDKLEKNFRHEKIMFEKVSDDLNDLEKAHAQRVSELTILKNRLNTANTKKDETLKLKEKYSSLLMENQAFQKVEHKRLKELEDFEKVLLRAEDKLVEQEREHAVHTRNLDENIEKLLEQNRIQEEHHRLEQKNIAELEESLKLYQADSQEAEFIISKDQFVQIEAQLETYQKEITFLKTENNALRAKLKPNALILIPDEKSLEHKVTELERKESDDSSMLEVFRETYKKITKA
ncbi:MAG: Unknown protein [uncultured Sulfurovum sp.]|uniref:Uncharacterized protein n=1 Tax=uncultured Sulfurovum sp. TaxID=269237 RepID=A0A6S6SBP1_9BACT|nr:MAG: Unknown protein [uncultured Sulfurovum sp.]